MHGHHILGVRLRRRPRQLGGGLVGSEEAVVLLQPVEGLLRRGHEHERVHGDELDQLHEHDVDRSGDVRDRAHSVVVERNRQLHNHRVLRAEPELPAEVRERPGMQHYPEPVGSTESHGNDVQLRVELRRPHCERPGVQRDDWACGRGADVHHHLVVRPREPGARLAALLPGARHCPHRDDDAEADGLRRVPRQRVRAVFSREHRDVEGSAVPTILEERRGAVRFFRPGFPREGRVGVPRDSRNREGEHSQRGVASGHGDHQTNAG
mmetsp:Transcript_35309/g.92263  ORF Transcript_35309/g.92263 Transcript_35309/m.92263 type:complete len:266 (-) Transcript_35309:957-1754(-)